MILNNSINTNKYLLWMWSILMGAMEFQKHGPYPTAAYNLKKEAGHIH